ncbi:MAG: AAA family ATPase [Anaerolineales bacterium]
MAQTALRLPRQAFLFGPLRVQDSQGSRTLTGEKVQNLLAYLLLHPGTPHSRERLADVLFPASAPDRVRRNFSDTLYRLQKTLDNDWLIVEGETIRLRVADHLLVDVWEFDRLTASENPADWQQALEYYTGDLLPECYEDWILPERELRRNQFLFALENLAARQQTAGNLQQALLTIRRLILTEPLHEPAHQTYLRLLGRLQRYGEAQAHYEYLRGLLRTELDAEPLAETQQIIHALRQEHLLATVPFQLEETIPFVGRTTERALALEAVEAALRGKGGLLAIEGTAGIGKSRLLREIAAGARWRGATVLHSAVHEIPTGSPYTPLAVALAPIFNPPNTPLEASLPPEILPVLKPLNPAWENHPLASPAPEQAIRAFNNALQVFGETLARFNPLIFLLDDVQWASPAMWDSLQTLVPPLLNKGTLFVVAYRRETLEATAGWETLQAWDRAGDLKIIQLPPLTVEEVAQLAPDTTEPEILHALTGGNPFRIRERLETLQANPAAHRLEELSAGARDMLACAAVLGNFSYPIWVQVAGILPIALANLSDELVAHHWLHRTPSGFALVHDLLRTAIYEKIPAASLRALHTRAARAYQTLEPDNVRTIAYHFERAGLAAEAAHAYRRAGDQDLAQFAYRDAQTAYRRALAYLPPSPTRERIEIMLSLAWTWDVIGEQVPVQEILEEALAGSQQLCNKPLQLRAMLALGRTRTLLYQFSEALPVLLNALTLAKKLQEPSYEAEAHLLLAMYHTSHRFPLEAQKHYLKALKLARKVADRVREARALRGLGIVAREVGKPQESLKWLAQAASVQQQLGDRLGEASTLSGMVTAYYDLGAWDQLIEVAEQVLPKTEALGYRYNAGYVRQLQGLASFHLGEYPKARRQFQQARKDFEAVRASTALVDAALGLVAEDEGDEHEALRLYRFALASIQPSEGNYETPVIQQDLGILLLKLEHPLEAIPLLEAAHATWLEQRDRLGQLRSGAYLGLAFLTIGNRSRAEEFAAHAWTEFQAGLPTGEKAQGWLWAVYQLFVTLGWMQADTILRAAYAELQRQALAIQNVDLRRSFFTRVPLNRAIVAAYDQLQPVPRTKTVFLAHRAAPLGRALREDELVPVQWTILAPEDEAISDKTAQRQHRLKRLLTEAEARGAAPTDDDLAQALNVSRRTILRDMQILAEELPRPPTRKRK